MKRSRVRDFGERALQRSNGIRAMAPELRGVLAVAAAIVFSSLTVTLVWLLVEDGTGSDAHVLALANARITAGSGQAGDTLTLRLDGQGRALVRLPLEGYAADTLPVLRIDARASSPEGRLLIFAAMHGDAQPRSVGVVDGLPDGPLTLYLGKVDDWSGSLREVLLGLEGSPGTSFELREVRLSPPSPATVFANTLQFWRRAGPWSMSSINAPLEPSALSVASPWTALLAVAALGVVSISLAAVALPRLAGASPARGGLVLGSGLILACWILLDLVWLDRQRVNALAAIDRFGSRSAEARPLAGPDASLVLLARRVEGIVERAGAGRIFVASSSDFLGMRAAYQLYPRNVYWKRHAELPPPDRLRRGDYVLLMKPTQHAVADGSLLFPEHPGTARTVTVLFESQNATFLRID